MNEQPFFPRKVRRKEAKSKMNYEPICESALKNQTPVDCLEDLLPLGDTSGFSPEPAQHRDFYRDIPRAIRIGCYQSDLQIFDRAQNLLGSPFICVATEIATGILIATETLLRAPDTMTMQHFCRRVLQQLGATPATVSFRTDYTAGINWNRIGMKLGLRIATIYPVRRHSPLATDEFLRPVRGRNYL